jgi:ribonuclease HI
MQEAADNVGESSMSYQFPASLYPLRYWLRAMGLEGDSIKTSRQAAFMAQQLLGSRVKFPPPGSDMTSTLFLIQKQLPGVIAKALADHGKAVETSVPRVIAKQASSVGAKNARRGSAGSKAKSKPQPEYLSGFDLDLVQAGYHVFADGACVPNPGPGGWGIVAYKDGQEIASDCGGEAEATNNSMELTALLQAVEWACQHQAAPVTVWSDSQYGVRGIHEWMAGWKRQGWQRGGDKAEPKNRILANADLWQGIDAALSGPRAAAITVRWIKGHAGHLGNERADELAEMGRQAFAAGQMVEDLDAEYRSIMAGG